MWMEDQVPVVVFWIGMKHMRKGVMSSAAWEAESISVENQENHHFNASSNVAHTQKIEKCCSKGEQNNPIWGF